MSHPNLSGRGRHGVTLVEVMISVALSVVVLLLAFTAFRVATQSISHLNRLETENTLLRHGVTQAIDDADFWNQEANPEFPYGRAYAAYQNVDVTGKRVADAEDPPPPGVPAVDTSHANNKRPFRRVEFAADGVQNVNWLLPHDPRSWYRNMVYSNPRPLQADYINGSYNWTMGWYGGKNSYSVANWQLGRSGNGSISIIACWTPRLIWGDYAEIASFGYISPQTSAKVGYVPTANSTDEASVRGGRAGVMDWLFRQIGTLGVANYLPQGTMTTFLRPSVNLYNNTAFSNLVDSKTGASTPTTDVAMHYDQGEIPWQLDRPENLKNGGNWDTKVTRPSAAAVTDNNRMNYMEALQFHHAQLALDWATANRQVGLLYGMGVTDGATPWSTVTAATRQGWSSTRFLEDTGVYGTTTFASWNAGPEAEKNRTNTYLVPADLSGNPNPWSGDRTSTLPLLRTSSFRYRYNGGDICNLAVRIEQPNSGRVQDFGFSVLGTTYRGARQHWALRTWNMTIAADNSLQLAPGSKRPAMGDYYK